MTSPSPFGLQLRYWRRSRGISQLELALRARSTPRYVSFMENGRSRPSQQMVHRIADALDVPMRERNDLLEAAGFAGSYQQRSLTDASMTPYCQAIRHVLAVHEPFPATVVNRWWDVIDANQASQRFLTMLDPKGGPPRNLVQWFFESESTSRRCFENWADIAFNFLYRIRREMVAAPSDERLQELVSMAEKELAGMASPEYDPSSEMVVCPTMRVSGEAISVVGMVSRFGSAREVTLEELRLESLYPQDETSAAFFRRLAEQPPLRMAT